MALTTGLQEKMTAGRDPVTSRSALLWNTHVWCSELEEEFEKFLALDYPGSPEVWLVIDAGMPGAAALKEKYERVFVIDPAMLFEKLPYPRFDGKGILHHSHFPVLDFFLSHRGYDYYWFMEFDVRYTGSWESFLRMFEPYPHDFIASHIRHIRQEPHWLFWDTLRHPEKTIDRERLLRSYNVIYRISNRALSFIDGEQRDGWQGFNEVSLPTLLHCGGYRIMDFGGNGTFTPPELHNRTYTSHGLKTGFLNPFCTMFWRPTAIRPGIRKNKIYHSVKPRHMREPFRERLRYLKTWMRELIRYDLLGRS